MPILQAKWFFLFLFFVYFFTNCCKITVTWTTCLISQMCWSALKWDHHNCFVTYRCQLKFMQHLSPSPNVNHSYCHYIVHLAQEIGRWAFMVSLYQRRRCVLDKLLPITHLSWKSMERIFINSEHFKYFDNTMMGRWIRKSVSWEVYTSRWSAITKSFVCFFFIFSVNL